MPVNQLVAYKIMWLEHLTHNQRVTGSSPVGTTLKTPLLEGFFVFLNQKRNCVPFCVPQNYYELLKKLVLCVPF